MSIPIRLLLVEDDEDDYFLFTSSLRSTSFNKEIIWANTYKKAVEIIDQNLADIIIVDYRLGAHTGIELIAYINEKFPYTPTILLTGLRAPAVDEEALRFGAYDYLVKDQYTSESLDRSIRYALEKSKVLKSLKESENKFRSLFENAVEYVFIIDESQQIIDVNKSALKLFSAVKKEEVIGWNISKYITPAIINVEDCINQSFEIGFSVSAHFADRFCIVNLTIVDTEKKIYQMVLHDITERINNEQREKLLEKQALTGKVARVIAHEIKNPLTNIHLSLAELKAILKDPNSVDDPQDFLDIIDRNGKRINLLIEDLLNATRFDTINYQNLFIDELLAESIHHVSDRTKLKDILVTNNSEKGLMIKGDREKLVIAILNVLVNAVEAAPEKRGVIHIDTERIEDMVCIVIKDNGKGIPDSDIDKLFEPFFTSKKGGTGLGLTATYNIISKHDGIIEVDSEVNVGTSFMITLPLALQNN